MEKKRLTRFRRGETEFLVIGYPRVSSSLNGVLTEAELEVGGLVLEGCSNQEIARRRSTSRRTVEHQVASILQKLGVTKRRELFAALQGGRS